MERTKASSGRVSRGEWARVGWRVRPEDSAAGSLKSGSGSSIFDQQTIRGGEHRRRLAAAAYAHLPCLLT